LRSLLWKYLNSSLRFTRSKEIVVIFFTKLFTSTVLCKSCLLAFFGLVVLNHLLELSHLIYRVLEEDSSFFELLTNTFKFISVLMRISSSLSCLMHHNDESNYIKFLFVDSVLVEKSFFVGLQNSFFEFYLNFNDFVFDVFQSELPGFTLLFLKLFFFLQELSEFLLFIFRHFLFRLRHPIFTNQLHF